MRLAGPGGTASGSGTPAFNPNSIANLGAWYDSADASTITQTGGAVSQVNDKSGNNRNATQATGANQPQYVAGKGIVFNGTSDTLAFDGTFLANTNYTIFVVENPTSQNYFIGGTGNGSNTNLQVGYNGSNLTIGQFSNDFNASTGVIPLNGVTRVWTAQLNGSGHFIYIDGILKGSNSNTTQLGAFNGATLGGRLLNATYYGGAIKEVLIYSRGLTSTEITNVNNYLKAKWETAPLLRVATVQNRTSEGNVNQTAMNGFVFRWPHVIGQDMQTLVVSSYNWWQNYTSETSSGNAYTIVDCSIELNGVVVPVTYSGGRNITLASSASDVQSDALAASAFGLSVIPKGTTFWTKMRITVPATGNSVPSSNRLTTDVSGSQAGYYNTSVTTPSSTDVSGQYTATGVAFSAQTAGFCPIIIGTPVADSRSFFVTGDSISHYAYDNSPSDIYGQAFVQRSMRSAVNDDLLPCINASRYGCTSSMFIQGGNGGLWQTYSRYANVLIDEVCTNDIGTAGSGLSAATIEGILTMNYQYAHFVNQKIIRTHLLPRVTSTDNVLTTANQTYLPSWGVGQTSATLNAWFDSKVNDGTTSSINVSVPFTSIRDTTFTLKWAVDGVTPNKYVSAIDGNTTEDTHPTPLGHESMAIELRPIVRSV